MILPITEIHLKIYGSPVLFASTKTYVIDEKIQMTANTSQQATTHGCQKF